MLPDFPEGSYLRHLTDKAAGAGKAPTWAREVFRLYVQRIRPKWGHLTLSHLSDHTGAVRGWHNELTKEAGPVCANHCARICAQHTGTQRGQVDISSQCTTRRHVQSR